MSTWGGSTWGGTTWGYDPATDTPPPPGGEPTLTVTPVDGTEPDCVLQATHRASLYQGWLQQDDLAFQVPGAEAPDLSPTTLITLEAAVDGSAGLETVGPWGRYRVLQSAPGYQRDATHQRTRHVLAQDWLRAALTQPWGDRAAYNAVLPAGFHDNPILQVIGAATDGLAPGTAGYWEVGVYNVLVTLAGVDGTVVDHTATRTEIYGTTSAVSPTVPEWPYLYRGLHYEATTTWRDVLTEIAGTPQARGGRTRWGVPPLRATYDGDGVLHLRNAAQAWGAGWGWASPTGSAEFGGIPLPLTAPFQEEINDPAYDTVYVWDVVAPAVAAATVAPGTGAAEAAAGLGEAALLATKRLNTSWYEYVADLKRSLDVPVMDPALIAQLAVIVQANPTFYANQLADAVLADQIAEARNTSITLGNRPWWYAELTQTLTLLDPPATRGTYRLTGTSTNLVTAAATWQVARVADLGAEG